MPSFIHSLLHGFLSFPPTLTKSFFSSIFYFTSSITQSFHFFPFIHSFTHHLSFPLSLSVISFLANSSPCFLNYLSLITFLSSFFRSLVPPYLLNCLDNHLPTCLPTHLPSYLPIYHPTDPTTHPPIHLLLLQHPSHSLFSSLLLTIFLLSPTHPEPVHIPTSPSPSHTPSSSSLTHTFHSVPLSSPGCVRQI